MYSGTKETYKKRRSAELKLYPPYKYDTIHHGVMNKMREEKVKNEAL